MPSVYHARRSAPRRFSSAGRSRTNQRSAKKGAKQNIHPSKFIQAARPVTVEEYQPTHTFTDFAINDLLKRNISAKGFVSPSKIQDLAIPVGLQGRDVIGIANTGTGKTTAFALPVINKLMEDRGSRALIIAPTRELAAQIEEECRSFARGSGLFGTLLIGGTPMHKQLRELRSKPQVIIGTPGRIIDHVRQGNLELGSCNMVVLDEVDRMVDMGFINDIRFLLGEVNEIRQSFFFSATLDPAIESLVNSFLKNPELISVRTGDTSDSVEQDIVKFNDRDQKFDLLRDILNSSEVEKAIVFDGTKYAVEKLGRALEREGFKAEALHGGKTQGQRQKALSRFKDNQANVLVATDVAARGIDVADITHVINYSVPQTYDDYTHRIGRAGRAGKTGKALTFIEARESRW